jgi:hypothetical protein
VTPESIGPGLLFSLVFIVLALATVLLLRSLNKQLRKVPPSFDQRDDRLEK